MRKLVMLNRMSLDGFFAGPNGEIDWFIHDYNVDKTAREMIEADTLLLGRKTYQQFEAYWPQAALEPNAPEAVKATAKELTDMTKLVFSKTLKSASWENTRLYHDEMVKVLQELKQANGASILIFGSGTIVQQLSNAGLIDEYLIILSPVVLGKGKTLFQDVKKLNLEPVETKNFASGNLLIRYRS